MERVLGIDTGTNSLGWAIVDRQDDGRISLVDKGVCIFQEGVKIENGNESSKAAERTMHRATRVRYYRIRLRKIRLLRILSDNHLCPPLTKKELSDWRLHKIYPQDDLFMKWQRTDDEKGVNPYYYRHLCLHEKLNLDDLTQRYILGRAFYHLIQRRGFLSNRKDVPLEDENKAKKEGKAAEEGKVKEGISSLTKEMNEAGFEYLGDYFYHLYKKGEKIRNHYTAREEHYRKEFRAICSKQELSTELTAKIEKAIFDQRPLKSQKGQVGKCTFEKNKPRCPVSHPLFEEFRMLSFLNNVKIKKPSDDILRPLNDEERRLAASQFYRKSKPKFDFEDIAKRIAGKGNYGHYKSENRKPFLFNFPNDYPVSGCPVTAQLKDLFGEDWVSGISEVYSYESKAEKSNLDIVNDVWHALFFYSDEDKLAEFGRKHLQLSDTEAAKFSKIRLPGDYASLSLKAIRKILPYLRKGMIYSHAVFLANLDVVAPQFASEEESVRETIENDIEALFDDGNVKISDMPVEDRIGMYIKCTYPIDDKALKKLYHPSMIDVYPKARPNKDGITLLGSPRTNSVRNPMAMRAMFRLRKLVNELLREGKITPETTINIEFARELNDANRRKAIAEYQRGEMKKRDDARREILELYKEATGRDIEPSERDILKYILWKEQERKCLYTGEEIGVTAFIGDNPQYDIEHTVPQSVGGDSTRMNLTLCSSRFNREVKRTKLPTQLANYGEILQRVQPWKDKYETLEKQIRANKKKGNFTDKDAKDKHIQNRHKLMLERDYLRGKYERFTMTSVPEGFSRRQGTDISVISRYARLYLKSVFERVFTVRGIATSDFRKMWGIQDEYSKKERVNHIHHCIDAVVIACISPHEYSQLAHYYHELDQYRYYGKTKPAFSLPWPTFVRDLKALQDEVLIPHHTQDNMPKQGRRRIVVKGQKVLAKGDSARGSLHKDTYYGAIAEQSTGDIRYVVRKDLNSLKEKDIKNIVDDTVREIIRKAVAGKDFAKALAEPIWMNEEKGIPIKKVRCYDRVTEPINIRHHRDSSDKEYKRQFHVAKDSNYLVAIYEGKTSKGKTMRSFEILDNLQAAEYYKSSSRGKNMGEGIVPKVNEKGESLVFTLRTGTMVLFYENDPDEIWNGKKSDLPKRLYKVTTMEKDGRVTFRHHEDAMQAKDVKDVNSRFVLDMRSPKLRLSKENLTVLVEGYDFRITETGKIIRLR